MYNTSSSPQVGYTLSVLSEALFSLLRTQGFESVTVTELCKKAGVSRKSFYRNCLTRTDLVDYRVEGAARRLLATVDWDCEESEGLFQNFFRFWYGERELLAVLYKQALFPHFCQVFTGLCCKETQYRFLELLLQNSRDPESMRQFNHAFVVGGLCQVLEEWTREGFQTPPEELAALLCRLSPQL